jgi:hypothetical protein
MVTKIPNFRRILPHCERHTERLLAVMFVLFPVMLGCDSRVNTTIDLEAKKSKGPIVRISPTAAIIQLLPGTSGSLSWQLENVGNELLIVDGISSSCGCAKPRVDSREIKAGDRTFIWLEFSGTEFGTRDHLVRVVTNDPVRPEFALPVRSVVQYPVEVFPAALSLVGRVGEQTSGSVVIRAQDHEPITILGIEQSDAAISYKTELGGDRSVRLEFTAEVLDRARQSSVLKLHFSHSLGDFTFDLPVIVAAQDAPKISPERVILNDCRPGTTHQLSFKTPASERVINVWVENNQGADGPFLLHSYRTEDDATTGLGKIWVQVSVGNPLGYHSAVIKLEFEGNAVESVQISGYGAEGEGCD